MPSTISSFLQNYKTGFARPNRYKVSFILPSGIADSGIWMNNESSAGRIGQTQWNLNSLGEINLGCHSAAMPGRTLITATHKHIGGPFNIPYSQTYDPVTFSFYADRDMAVRKYFDIWQTAVINITDNSVNFWNEYVSDITITSVDRQNSDRYSITLYDCFPLSIGEITFSYAAHNELLNVTVTMSYKLWKASHDETQIKTMQ